MSTASLVPYTKSFSFSEVKSLDDNTGEFTGLLACFHNIDSYKDIIEPGAFTKTIKDARGRGGKYLFPLLWQHNPAEPIGGFLEMREDGKGLFVKGQIDLNTDNGKRAYSGLKMGYLDGLSIGYDTIKQKFNGEIRHLLEVRMWEGSIVTFPANPQTRVNAVKSACGSTSFELAGRDVEWDAGKARSQYQEWAKDDNGDLIPSKLKQVHFYCDESANPKTIGAYKLPFCYISGDTPQAIPRGVMAVAGVLQGSMGGGDFGGADDSIKSKVASYYSKMRSTFNDPDIVAPWLKKARDFNSVISDRAPGEAMEDLYDLLSALMTTVLENISGTDDADMCSKQVGASLKQFQDAVMSWLDDAWDAGLGSSSDGYDDDTKSLALAHFGVSRKAMRQAVKWYRKEGRAISNNNRTKISSALDTIQQAIKDLQSLLEDTNIYKPGDAREDVPQPENDEKNATPEGNTSSPTGPIQPVVSKSDEELSTPSSGGAAEEMLDYMKKLRSGLKRKEEVA